MRTAVIGGGLAGLSAAWFLRDRRELTIFEASTRVGGALRSTRVEDTVVDLGFAWFAPSTHPRLSALVRSLGLPTETVAADVSLHERDRGDTLTLPPSSSRHIATLARRPDRVSQLLRFKRLFDDAAELVERGDWQSSMADFAREQRLDSRFQECFLYPWIDATLGGRGYETVGGLAAYPALFHFLAHRPRGMEGPRWLSLRDGAEGLVSALTRELSGVELRLQSRVVAVDRGDSNGKLRVQVADAPEPLEFDELIVAAPAALPLVGMPALPTSAVDLVIHRDPSWMPRKRRDWSLFNIIDFGGRAVATVRLEPGRDLFKTWLAPATEAALARDGLRVTREITRARYSLPLYPPGWELAGEQRPPVVVAAGAMHGVDIAESAVLGATRAAKALDPSLSFRAA